MAAIGAWDIGAVEALVAAGADARMPLPDGGTPLEFAVEQGSPALFDAARGQWPAASLTQADRARLLTLARQWYETGVQEMLRHRSAAALGQAKITPVADGEWDWVEEVALGGHRVRAGHGALLTTLEWESRMLTPVGELIDRAVRHTRASWDEDLDHVDRAASLWVLASRYSWETWTAVTDHRRHPDPQRRRFAAQFLRLALHHEGSRRNSYAKDTARVLDEWAGSEQEPTVLEALLRTCADADLADERVEEILLACATHPDARVRRAVPLAVREVTEPMAQALLALARDPDAQVRARAANELSGVSRPPSGLARRSLLFSRL
ncbi:HEAT repeat domain-containing protein [Streptomyces sp. NPDC001941]|uniref:HEAT repeat domain-containing protein n=1 Tax=Streptomyces sp. NPDC001941 TaxID=3154659 RepID=UPI003318A0F0